MSGTFERVKFNLGNGYRDVLATDGKISTGARGTIYVVDCELSGATYGNMINGGVSNNALSCDATADHYVIGGKYHDSGGDCIQSAGSTSNSTRDRVYVTGVEAYKSAVNEDPNTILQAGALTAVSGNTVTLATTATTDNHAFEGFTLKIVSGTAMGQSRKITGYSSGRVCTLECAFSPAATIGDSYEVHPAGFGLSQSGIRANWIENCYIHDCPTGIFLMEAVATDGEMYDLALVRNCRLVADSARANSDANVSLSGIAGVSVQAKTAIVENCSIEGWSYATTSGSLYSKSSGINAQSAGAGFSLRAVNCWFKDCFDGVLVTGFGGTMLDVERCLFTGTPGPGNGAGTYPAAIFFSGESESSQATLRLTNNTFSLAPATAAGYIIYVDGVNRDDLGGFNYYAHNGNLTAFSGWTPYDTDQTTKTPAELPIFDDNGRLVQDSPGQNWGRNDAHPPQSFNGDRIESAVVSGAIGNSAASFKTVLTKSMDDYYKNQTLLFTSGSLKGHWRRIIAYTASTKVVTIRPYLTAVPSSGDAFVVLPPIVPSSGNAARFLYSGFTPNVSAFPAPRDMFGRLPWATAVPDQAAQSGIGRVVPGPQNIPTPRKTQFDQLLPGGG